jgi:hypothetical protein
MTSSTDTAPVEVTAADAFDQVMQAKRAERVGDPPPEPVIETKTPETPADAGVSASEPQEIDLEALPPAVRARLEKAEADIKAKEAEVAKERSEKLAAIGRLGPTQRQLAELQRERAKPAPAKAEPAPVETDYYASAEWKEYERDFPTEAARERKRDEAAAKRIAAAEQKLAEIEQATASRLAKVDQLVGQQDTHNEYAVLDAAHPDWRELVEPAADVSPDKVARVNWQDGMTALPVAPSDLKAEAIVIPTQDGDVVLKRDYYDWLASQDEDIQRWQFNPSGTKASRLLDAYKRDLALADLHDAQASAASEPAAPDPQAAAALAAQQRREQARAAAVTPDLRGGSQPAARVDVARLPEADQFDHALRQLRERRRQANT